MQNNSSNSSNGVDPVTRGDANNSNNHGGVQDSSTANNYAQRMGHNQGYNPVYPQTSGPMDQQMGQRQPNGAIINGQTYRSNTGIAGNYQAQQSMAASQHPPQGQRMDQSGHMPHRYPQHYNPSSGQPYPSQSGNDPAMQQQQYYQQNRQHHGSIGQHQSIGREGNMYPPGGPQLPPQSSYPQVTNSQYQESHGIPQSSMMQGPMPSGPGQAGPNLFNQRENFGNANGPYHDQYGNRQAAPSRDWQGGQSSLSMQMPQSRQMNQMHQGGPLDQRQSMRQAPAQSSHPMHHMNSQLHAPLPQPDGSQNQPNYYGNRSSMMGRESRPMQQAFQMPLSPDGVIRKLQPLFQEWSDRRFDVNTLQKIVVFARDHYEHAKLIVSQIIKQMENKYRENRDEQYIYIIHEIITNVQGNYVKYFGERLRDLFVLTWSKTTNSQHHIKLLKIFKIWDMFFDENLLNSISNELNLQQKESSFLTDDHWLQINERKRKFKPNLCFLPAHLIREGNFICSSLKRPELLREFEQYNNNGMPLGGSRRPQDYNHSMRMGPGQPNQMMGGIGVPHGHHLSQRPNVDNNINQYPQNYGPQHRPINQDNSNPQALDDAGVNELLRVLDDQQPSNPRQPHQNRNEQPQGFIQPSNAAAQNLNQSNQIQGPQQPQQLVIQRQHNQIVESQNPPANPPQGGTPISDSIAQEPIRQLQEQTKGQLITDQNAQMNMSAMMDNQQKPSSSSMVQQSNDPLHNQSSQIPVTNLNNQSNTIPPSSHPSQAQRVPLPQQQPVSNNWNPSLPGSGGQNSMPYGPGGHPNGMSGQPSTRGGIQPSGFPANYPQNMGHRFPGIGGQSFMNPSNPYGNFNQPQTQNQSDQDRLKLIESNVKNQGGFLSLLMDQYDRYQSSQRTICEEDIYSKYNRQLYTLLAQVNNEYLQSGQIQKTVVNSVQFKRFGMILDQQPSQLSQQMPQQSGLITPIQSKIIVPPQPRHMLSLNTLRFALTQSESSNHPILKHLNIIAITQLYQSIKFQCSNCGLRFLRNMDLKVHLDQHFAENNEIRKRKKIGPSMYPNMAVAVDAGAVGATGAINSASGITSQIGVHAENRPLFQSFQGWIMQGKGATGCMKAKSEVQANIELKNIVPYSKSEDCCFMCKEKLKIERDQCISSGNQLDIIQGGASQHPSQIDENCYFIDAKRIRISVRNKKTDKLEKQEVTVHIDCFKQLEKIKSQNQKRKDGGGQGAGQGIAQQVPQNAQNGSNLPKKRPLDPSSSQIDSTTISKRLRSDSEIDSMKNKCQKLLTGLKCVGNGPPSMIQEKTIDQC